MSGTPRKPCLARFVRLYHARHMTDGEMASKIGASVQRVSATRKHLGLSPHIVSRTGVRQLNVCRTVEPGKFRPGHKLPDDKIVLLYAGRRYG